MKMMSLAVPLLLVTVSSSYLAPVVATTVVIPWGLKPSQVYSIHTTNPKYVPPHPAPHKAPTKVPVKPTPTTTSPPPPSPATYPPPPAPVIAGRRKLLASKYLYPYRYLTTYSASAHTYKFKTLTVKPGTKLQFEIGLSGSTGHHGLARTTSKYRCGHAVETYLKPISKRKNLTVTLPHKGTYNFYDPTFSPVPVRNSKGKIVKYKSVQYDCQHLFISLTVVVS